MLDFIIVGDGLAAHSMAHRFLENGISFTLIGNPDLSKCSQVAAGIWNPIVFKRMTKSWLADELIPELLHFYRLAETRLQKVFLTERTILKPFFSEEEKQFWYKKSQSTLHSFLSSETHDGYEQFKNLIIPRDYGIVKQSGNINMMVFLKATENYLLKNKLYTKETFDYAALVTEENFIRYKNIEAKHIVFCEGHLVKNNPLFSWIPLKPVKGEVFEIETESIQLKNTIYNRDGFILPLGANTFKVGATYDWSDLTENKSKEGKEELIAKLKKMTTAEYRILQHQAGIRPSSFDRRPIIGSHPVLKHVFVFNGLGTKGVMLAPYVTKNFVTYFLNQDQLHPEIDISRFYKHYPI